MSRPPEKNAPSENSDDMLISSHLPSPEAFPNINEIIDSFRKPSFLQLSVRKRFKEINQTLCELIVQAPQHSFLFSAVIDYFARIDKEQLLNEPLNFSLFEFWLNTFSDFDSKKNYEIRAKIAGKLIPRSDYQAFFPIGMDKSYKGTHFIAAHLSPDIDTMTASFWGWVDAFAARVGSGLHIWSLPSGAPDSPFTTIFQELLGPALFHYLPRTAQTLTLNAGDLVSQREFKKEFGATQISAIDHGSDEKAVILVNDQGHYLGDWRSSDVELVMQVTILFKSCLHWFENNIHSNLISLFAKEKLLSDDFLHFNTAVFGLTIQEWEPVLDFNEKQKNDLNEFFKKILGVKEGLKANSYHLNEALQRLSIEGISTFQKEIYELPSSDIFDSEGKLKEDRPKIFNRLKEVINHLNKAMHQLRAYVERLDVVMQIKYTVLGLPYAYATLNCDVDEIKQKMLNYDFLTVIIHDQEGVLFPVGVVRARDLRETYLGTVSLRDFSNFDEVKMASYLQVISVIDHHKSSLKTGSVPTAIIGDAQSVNVIMAEQCFLINDRHSTGGMTLQQIDAQIQEIPSPCDTQEKIRLLTRLLQRRLAAVRSSKNFIHPQREFSEYLTFLHAILDDTDLLSKTSHRDLECIAQLLNRLKSLSLRREVEIIHFDDIPKDNKFTKLVTKRILQQKDMYSIYKKIYKCRESEVEINLDFCMQGNSSNIFLDTKEQNGCARVGQTKMFASNFPYFLKHASPIRQQWISKAEEVFHEKNEIDLHIQMISTIPSADEVFTDRIGPYEHQDELWFWTPSTQTGYSHLNYFLSGFQSAIQSLQDGLSIDFIGNPDADWLRIFQSHFPNIPQGTSQCSGEKKCIVLRFKPSSLNSRKAMISPFLPRLIS
jgi:hypothetical protein